MIKCFNKLPPLQELKTKSVLWSNLFRRGSEIIIDYGHQQSGSLTHDTAGRLDASHISQTCVFGHLLTVCTC